MPRHLTKQYNTWSYNRRVPKELKDHPNFKGKTAIRKSLKTDSLKVAITLRDEEDAKLEALISGGFIAEYETSYHALVEEEGQPITVTEERLEALEMSLGSMTEKYELGYHYDPAYKHDPELMATLDFVNKVKGKKHTVAITLIQAKELAKEKATKDGRARRYIQSFDNVVSKFLAFLKAQDVELARIDTLTVDSYVEHRIDHGATPKTAKNAITTLSTIFKTAQRKQLVEGSNPFKEPNISAKPTKRRNAFSRNDARKVLEALPERFELFWKIAYYAGMRRSELTKLSADNIVGLESEHGVVKCFSIAPDGDGKTENATRYIPIHPDLEEDLEGFNGFDFAANTFGNHRLRVTRELFGDEYAVTHDLHSLRHTFSTTLHNHLTEKPNMVDWLTGHSRTNYSESYRTYFHGYGLDKLYEAVKAIPSL